MAAGQVTGAAGAGCEETMVSILVTSDLLLLLCLCSLLPPAGVCCCGRCDHEPKAPSHRPLNPLPTRTLWTRAAV